MKRRRKKLLKLVGIGLTACAFLLFAGALAMADPGQDGGVGTSSTADTVARAQQAAAALADAHRWDRAVALLSSVAQREAAAITTQPRPGAEQLLTEFSARAEEHLVSGSRNPAEAQQMLRNLVQQLRTGPATTAAPAPIPVEEQSEDFAGFGHDMTVEADQTVNEASVVGGNLTIRGHVLHDAVAVGGNLVLEPGARVDGDSVAIGGNVTLNPSARVEGDAVSIGGQTTIADGAWVGGERTQVGPGAWTRTLPFAHHGDQSHRGFTTWIGSLFKTIGLGLVMALIGIVIAALAPGRVRTIIATIRKKPGMSFFSGLLTGLVTITATVLLTITFIGIPLVPVLMVALALAVIVGMTGMACLIGEVLPGAKRKQRSALRCIVLGTAFFTIVSLVPLGWLVLGPLVTVSLGAVIVSRVGAVAP